MPRICTRRPMLWIVLLLFFLTTGFFYSTVEVHHRERADASVILRSAGGPVSVKVMTFNIRHAKGLDGKVDLDAVIREVQAIDPDIVALQEVDRFNRRSGYADQIQQLGEALDMHWSFAPAKSFFAREYGNAVLSKYPIMSSKMTMLPATGESRNALQTVVDVDGRMLRIWNTHLSLTLEELEQQIYVLTQLTSKDAEPYIVMGDFNISAQHGLMQKAIAEASWQHLYLGDATHISGRQLDHLFISANLSAHDPYIVNGTASDHYPVVAKLELE